jgi:hypothetical protein
VISLNALGPDHPGVGASYNNLGVVYVSQGQYDKAIEYYEKDFVIRLKALGPDHPQTKLVQTDLAVCKRASNRLIDEDLY